MNEPDVERMLLEYAVDDYIPLIHIVWRLDHRFPDESPTARREIADRCLRKLVSRGLVELSRGIRFQGEQVTVPPAGIDAALVGDEDWEPSEEDEEHTRFFATDAGVRYYQSLPEPANDEHN